jgi:hypothetical protein
MKRTIILAQKEDHVEMVSIRLFEQFSQTHLLQVHAVLSQINVDMDRKHVALTESHPMQLVGQTAMQKPLAEGTLTLLGRLVL